METGLNVYPLTISDKLAIEKLNYCGYTAEWNDSLKCFFFEESEDLYAELEEMIAVELGHNVDYRIERI